MFTPVSAITGFGLFVGHLAGDYIYQDDWQAKYKTMPRPGRCPTNSAEAIRSGSEGIRSTCEKTLSCPSLDQEKLMQDLFPHMSADQSIPLRQRVSDQLDEFKAWEKANADWKRGHLACTLHCLLYTFAIFCFVWWFPWWAYVAVFVLHWPVDRFRLARTFMKYTRHEEFATGGLAPWSIILTDNIGHYVVLYYVWLVVLLTT